MYIVKLIAVLSCSKLNILIFLMKGSVAISMIELEMKVMMAQVK